MYDVAIVGAGPVGLFLACELGLRGCSVVVLEREAEAGSVWRAAPLGLRGLMASSLAAFYRRGLLAELLESEDGSLIADQPLQVRGFGHFAGIMIDPAKVDVDALPNQLPTPAPAGL